MPVHVEKDGLAFDVLKADVAGVGQPLLGVAVAHGFGHRRQQTLLQLVAQSTDPRVFLCHPLPGKLTGLAQADNCRHVLGAAPAAFS